MTGEDTVWRLLYYCWNYFTVSESSKTGILSNSLLWIKWLQICHCSRVISTNTGMFCSYPPNTFIYTSNNLRQANYGAVYLIK